MLCHVVRAAQELQHSKVVIVGSPHSGAAVQQVMTATEFCSQMDLLHLSLQHAIWSQHYCKCFIRVMVQVLEGAFPSLGHDIVLQEKPTGFRDAVMAGLQSLPDSTADLLVIPGNLPLLTSQTLLEVVQQGQRTAIDKHRGLTQLCTSDYNEPSGIFWAAAAFLREKLRDLPNGMPCLRLHPLLSKQHALCMLRIPVHWDGIPAQPLSLSRCCGQACQTRWMLRAWWMGNARGALPVIQVQRWQSTHGRS